MSLLDIASSAFSLLSTGVQIYGALKGGADKGDSYDAAATSAYIDARRALIDARLTREVAVVEASKINRSGAEYRSAARAQFGANGVDVNSGSARDVQRDITHRAGQDAIERVLLGERQALALEDNANSLISEAGQYAAAGDNARSAGNWSAAAAAISGAGDIWKKYRAATGGP